MGSDDTPPSKGDPDTLRAQQAFLKSCDASRAVADMADAVTAQLDATDNVGIPIANLDDEDSLVIAIEGAMTMNTQRSARATRLNGEREVQKKPGRKSRPKTHL